MKTSDFLKVVLTKILRDKKNKFYIPLLTIFTILTILILVFYYNFVNFINDSINKNIGFRTISVSTKIDSDDLGISEIKDIQYVKDVYNSYYDFVVLPSSFESDDYNGYVDLIYGGASLPEVVYGDTFEDGSKNVAICPMYFYPDNNVYDLKINTDKIIDGRDLLGEKFSVSYSSSHYEGSQIVDDKSFSREFTIIGIYDNTENMNVNNQCYIPYDDLKDIIDTKTPEGANESFYPSFYVIIDSTEHLDYVVEKLTEAGFQNIEYKTTIDYDMVRIILLSCYIITSLTLFIVIVITSFYVKKKLLNESSDIGIYKVFGFDKSIVRKLYILEILSLNLISFVLGLILFIILFLVLKFFTFSSLMFIGVNIHLNISSIIISLIIIIVFPIVLNIPKLTKKINSNIIDLIEGDDK